MFHLVYRNLNFSTVAVEDNDYGFAKKKTVRVKTISYFTYTTHITIKWGIGIQISVALISFGYQINLHMH
jgi:hypothetical protein